ncbi:MAG: hypothetical protein MK078_15425 [Crocinitomicaceae bacterium]|nr:hypothetical protein [Crocinitomicaceae bacterium]
MSGSKYTGVTRTLINTTGIFLIIWFVIEFLLSAWAVYFYRNWYLRTVIHIPGISEEDFSWGKIIWGHHSNFLRAFLALFSGIGILARKNIAGWSLACAVALIEIHRWGKVLTLEAPDFPWINFFLWLFVLLFTVIFSFLMLKLVRREFKIQVRHWVVSLLLFILLLLDNYFL